MKSVKLSKRKIFRIILLQLISCITVFCVSAQAVRKFEKHEVVDVGGGMKAEVLQCRGEGPLEECDVIYYSTRRQEGTRVWRNANRLREEESAARLLRAQEVSEIRKLNSQNRTGSNTSQSKRAEVNNGTTREQMSANASKADQAVKNILLRSDASSANAANTSRINLEKEAKRLDSISKTRVDTMRLVILREVARLDSIEKAAANSGVISINNKKSTDEPIANTGIANDAVTVHKETPDTAATMLTYTTEAAPEKNSTANAVSAKDVINVNEPTQNAGILPAKDATVKNIASKPATSTVTPPEQKRITPEADMQNAVGQGITAKGTAPEIPVKKDAAPVDASGSAKTANQKVDLYKEVKRLDSVSKSKVDPIQLAIQREIDSLNAIEKAAVDTLKTILREETSQPDTSSAAGKEASGTKGLQEKVSSTALSTSGNTTTAGLNLPFDKIQREHEDARNDRVSEKVIPDAASIGNSGSTNTQKTETSQNLSPRAENVNSSPATQREMPEKETTTNNASASQKRKEKEGENSFVMPGNQEKATAFTKTAEVNIGGIWEKAVIIDKESEYLYKVHFEGNDTREDEWVAVTQLRNIDSSINRTTTTPVKALKSAVNCSFTAPAPPVSDAEKFSERLAKRKIYETYVENEKGSQTKIGISFINFQAGEPFVNSVTVSETNALEIKYALAPAGAMIYPIQAKLRLCEQSGGKTTSQEVYGNYACFRNKEGSWSCAQRN